MTGLPAHVPILSCRAGEAEFLLGACAGELSRLNIRAARITGGGELPSADVYGVLSDHEILLVENDGGDVVSLAAVSELIDVVGDSPYADPGQTAERIASWLTGCRLRTPLFGAVLIGGKSSRMGRPKHLITNQAGMSWLEYLISMFGPFVAQTVVSGGGTLPEALVQIERVDDLAGVEGPLTGIAALLRAFPFVSWLVCACDMPHITPASIEWLLDQRGDAKKAIIPRNPETGRSEPLFAWYDYRCRVPVDDLIASGSRKISDLCTDPAIYQPEIPQSLITNWSNINYPDQL